METTNFVPVHNFYWTHVKNKNKQNSLFTGEACTRMWRCRERVGDTAYCLINQKEVFFFLGHLSVISTGLHITADSCENTRSIEEEIRE